MLFKNRTVHNNSYPQHLAFNSVINNIVHITEKAENLDEKIGNLDYFISVITADLCADVGSRFIYKGHGEVIYFDIPMGSTDEDGAKWIHKYRDKQYDVSDFRTSVLYELSKMRYELLSDTR